MSKPFATGTDVPVDKTRTAIEKELVRFGADAFSFGYNVDRAAISFRARGRFIRLSLDMPHNRNGDFTRPSGISQRDRTAAQIGEALEAEKRRRWRALLLLIKAKLAAVEAGIVVFEEEFLPHTIMSDGATVWERSREPVAIEYRTGKVEPTLRLSGPKS